MRTTDRTKRTTVEPDPFEPETSAADARGDAFARTSDALSAWAGVADGFAPTAAAHVRTAARHVETARRLSQIGAATLSGLGRAIAAARREVGR